ncbi:hypothetical protein JJV70_03425 [Streptomyces sp. JJ66]|uniref:hypothetical protein n=1 Tax=Streptomyces sp. JJ66 TaxID=2803843 RepID=UPI001C564BF5|nr:hypothetical protein [Streptomyces sp. JJ66]MBW1601168.1 hypothetical protein [Streptomyces sp. JJ66]
MSHRRTLPALAAAAAATVLLAGCGGGGGGEKDDTIAGAQEPSHTATPSPDATEDGIERPDMTLPKDLKLVFDDWTTSAGPEGEAALRDAANYVRSIAHGIVKQDASDSAYLTYSVPLEQAQSYAKNQIEQYIEGGWTLTGTDRYYRPEVRVAEEKTRAAVIFCEDQSDVYGKDVESGEVLRDEEAGEGEAENYVSYEIVMQQSEKSTLWQAHSLVVRGKADECRD